MVGRGGREGETGQSFYYIIFFFFFFFFSVSQTLMHQIKVIIFYFWKFAGSCNELMLTIKTKKSLLIWDFSKISHSELYFTAIFFRDYFYA